MRNKSLRMVAFGAAISLAGALSACSTGPGTTSASPANLASGSVGAMKNFTAGEAFKATAPVSFSMLYSDPPTYPLKSDWLLFNAITKVTNVSLKPTIVPMSDYSAKRSLLIGAGSAPLIIPKTYPGQETPFIQSGAPHKTMTGVPPVARTSFSRVSSVDQRKTPGEGSGLSVPQPISETHW